MKAHIIYRLSFIALLIFSFPTLAKESHTKILLTSVGAPAIRAPLNLVEEGRLESEVAVFDNGNTFVRFKTEVLGQIVGVEIPAKMTANDWMEALIKIRTARTLGAYEVIVLSPEPMEKIKIVGDSGDELLMNKLAMIKVAGADGFINLKEGPQVQPLGRTRKLTIPRRFSKTLVAGFQHPELGGIIASSLQLPLITSLEQPSFKNAQIILMTSAVPPVNESFLRSVDMARRLAEKGARVIYLTGYLPYARSDKVDQPGVTITGRLVADLIEDAGVAQVVFARAHAPQSQGFFSIPTIQAGGQQTINALLKKRGVELIVAPDAGAFKDDSVYAKTLGLPIGVINKIRNPLTGEIKMQEFAEPSVAGKVVALIDDETASGGTLAMAAEFLKARGASRVLAVVVHLAGEAKKALESKAVDEIVVTDTIPSQLQSAKVNRISIGWEIAERIREIVQVPARACRDVLQK
jgi:ribose-phosphate pyrophosphokinase